MDLLLQIQSDQLGVPVTRPKNQETTALGAAYLAGVAESVWDGPSAVEQGWAVDRSFSPTADRTDADALHGRWCKAVGRSTAWAE